MSGSDLGGYGDEQSCTYTWPCTKNAHLWAHMGKILGLLCRRKALQGEATCLGPTSGRGRTAPTGLLFCSFFGGKRELRACFGVRGVRYQFII